ncbi:hypothetical protein I3843_09G005100 [Carya illinoinensis]|nr:hypothetical protein I3843_09G005100 [Carya illinoinensis]
MKPTEEEKGWSAVWERESTCSLRRTDLFTLFFCFNMSRCFLNLFILEVGVLAFSNIFCASCATFPFGLCALKENALIGSLGVIYFRFFTEVCYVSMMNYNYMLFA